MLVNKKAIHIEWGDCDPLGIVYYPRYFEFFDVCTDDLFAKAGLPIVKLLETYAIAGIPMVELRAVFTAPSAFGDHVTIESRVARWGTASFSVEHKLFKQTILAVECFEKRVWAVRSADPVKRIESRPIPPEVIGKFMV